jgi:predicted alpha/beta hydrolase family esterase
VTLLLVLLAAVVGLPVFLNGVAYATTRHVRRVADEQDSPPRAPFARIFVLESAAAVLCLAAWPLAELLARPRSGRAPRVGSAVLVAGCEPDRASFWLLARRLRRLGWRVHHCAPRRWPSDREAARRQIGACIDHAREGVEGPVVIVAHATGGLVARDFLRSRKDAAVGLLLTLGTAHQEAAPPTVRFSCLHGPGTGVVRELAEADPVPERYDVVAISSDVDAWVVPATAAYYPRAFNICVSDVGHFGLLVSRKVFGLVRENIDAAAPQARLASTASSTRATSSPSL